MAYLPLSTANLPDPVIDPAQGASPEDYFGIDTYSGTSATHERSALQFQPDFVWIKERNNAGLYHCLFDSIRGATNILYSNDTSAEATNANTLTSFDSDGFTLGNDSNNYGVNRSVGTYVAWNWKANGSGVTNTDGSITSTVSANTTSGFSICTYTGNNTNGATFGHGLNSAPEMVIFKRRDSTSSWAVGHADLGWDGIVILNSTNAFNTGYNIFNSTAPSSSVVTLGNTGDANEGTIVAYCFHSVEGFSKFGSYVGNGSTDGPFVYTGFRPAFVMVKNASAGWPWAIYDVERDTYNVVVRQLQPNSSASETTSSPTNDSFDFVSNGIKVRGTGSVVNASGNTYIYMAFAENPFKYSNAR